MLKQNKAQYSTHLYNELALFPLLEQSKNKLLKKYLSNKSIADSKMLFNILIRCIMNVNIQIFEIFSSFCIFHGSYIKNISNPFNE